MDEDGYMSIDPNTRDNPLPTINGKKDPPRNSLLWKILFGLSIVGNVVLAVLFIVFILPGLQNVGLLNLPSEPIPSCVKNCVPCQSANDSVIGNLTLDPNTGHPQLYVSPDLKSVRWKDTKQHVNNNPLRYNFIVISHQSLNSGKICWEVEVVEGGEWWGVGIVRESSKRNGVALFDPRGGYWGIQRHEGRYEAITYPRTNLTVCHPLKRIRVSLDYSQGLIAFFDGNTNAELFIFPKANFSGEKVRAWFLIYKRNGQLILHS